MRRSLPLLAVLAGTANAQDTGADVADNPGFFILLADLDPSVEGDYCWDAVGGSADSGDWLQAHSCHNRMGPMSDQELTTDYPDVGNIYFTLADLCVGARRVVAGGQLYVAECSTSSTQSWISSSDGRVHPANDTSLCVTVGRATPDGVSLFNRSLTLQACDDYTARLTAWSIPGGSVGI